MRFMTHVEGTEHSRLSVTDCILQHDVCNVLVEYCAERERSQNITNWQ